MNSDVEGKGGDINIGTQNGGVNVFGSKIDVRVNQSNVQNLDLNKLEMALQEAFEEAMQDQALKESDRKLIEEEKEAIDKAMTVKNPDKVKITERVTRFLDLIAKIGAATTVMAPVIDKIKSLIPGF